MAHGQITIGSDTYDLNIFVHFAATTGPLPPPMCPGLTIPANGKVVVNGTFPGDTAMYSCDMGFVLEGVDTITCEDDGAWSAGPPVCIREF